MINRRVPINPLRGEGKAPVEGKDLKQRAMASNGHGKKAGTNGEDYQNADLRA